MLLAQQPAILVLCSFTQKKLSNQFALFFGTSNFRVTLCWQGKAGEHFTWKQLQIYGGGCRLSPSGIRHLADPKGPPFILVWNIHFWLAREIPREIFAPLVKFLDPPLLARFISGIIIFLVKIFLFPINLLSWKYLSFLRNYNKRCAKHRWVSKLWITCSSVMSVCFCFKSVSMLK